MAGRDALDDQRAHQQGIRGPRRNAQGQHRNEMRQRGGVVGGFRAGDSLDRALAETGRILGQLPFHDIAGEGTDQRPGARQDAERGPDGGAAQNRRRRRFQIGLGRQKAGDFRAERHALMQGADMGDDVGEREQPDGGGDEIHAVVKRALPEIEPDRAGVHVGPDRAQKHAQSSPARRQLVPPSCEMLYQSWPLPAA